MTQLVFDIETVGISFDSLDEAQQEFIMRYAETESERETKIHQLNLYPLTAQIVAIGMLNLDTNRGKILYQSDETMGWENEEGRFEFLPMNENAMLETFWQTIVRYERFITFNGRYFDCPFLLLRSALLGIRPLRNLNTYRYNTTVHCDLLDQLHFFGLQRKFNLDFYCKAFGITSPKSGGITGYDMNHLFANKRYREIARYCLGDLYATAELYRKWESYLSFNWNS